MQRAAFILACFFICVTSIAQKYPFVHYSPKDGLISNQIRSIYQDSRGRLYFLSMTGLSLYDGSRFINYTVENGLEFDIVNTVMEMGEDSIWVVTNFYQINCFVNGKLEKLRFKNDTLPIINNLTKDDKGNLYAATDEGLFYLKDNEFVRLSLSDINGKDINFYLTNLISSGDYLLIQRDHSLLTDDPFIVYVYNTKTRKVTSQLEKIFFINQAPDGRIWVSTDTRIRSVDLTALKSGDFILRELPEQFQDLSRIGRSFLMFDRTNNCWVSEHNQKLIRAEPDGRSTTFTTASGLSLPYVNWIFRDKEGCTWIATNNTGVDKLINSNFYYYENPFGLGANMNITYNKFSDELLIYSPVYSKAAIVKNGELLMMLDIKNGNNFGQLIKTKNEFYGVDINTLYKLKKDGKYLKPELIMKDDDNHVFSNSIMDRHGNLLVCGRNYLTAVVHPQSTEISGKKEIICRKELDFFADYANTDSKGNIFVITRSGYLIIYETDPDDPSEYLKQKKYFKREFFSLSPRSFTLDMQDNLWIGTRTQGIAMYTFHHDTLSKQFQLTKASGLSENFITYLNCDEQNQIWACSNSGLDKISMRNSRPVIENLTKQNDIYQSVSKVFFDKSKTAWIMSSNGLIKITAEPQMNTDYSPSLMFTLVTAGKDTISAKEAINIPYRQNNLIFNFTATSFLDEHHIMYSYLLNGGSQTQWSDPSNITRVTFIDLHPGNYTLLIKARFPADRYPEQVISFPFSVKPAWWQTWWLRLAIGLLLLGVLVIILRFHYRRRLEKELVLLEKQQAIEKERTRIATDMHDDLGAGLSRIRFLSETIGLKKQKQEPFDEDISKISEYSHEMIDKMGEIVWALNEKNDTLSDLFAYTRTYAVEYLTQNGIACRVEAPEQFPTTFVSGEFRRNIYLTVKEALHNIVKHAQASAVHITMTVDRQLQIEVRDNGTGFDRTRVRAFSNGLSSMESRISSIKGKFRIENRDGTTIRIQVPLPE